MEDKLPIWSGIYLCRIHAENSKLMYLEPLQFNAKTKTWSFPGHTEPVPYCVHSWRLGNILKS